MNNQKNKPTSVGIIMDGNRRWAKKRMLPAKLGHAEGGKTLKKICEAANEMGIKYLILYAFSTENWKRSQDEIDEIMRLIREFLDEFIQKFKSQDTRIRFIGDRSRLDKDIIDKMNYVEDLTKDKEGTTLVLAVNYGGRDDIIRAFKKINNFGVDINELTENDFANYLDTAGIENPELIIRTSGEQRISNFLIWQSAYSEFYFVDKYWPDFTKADLEDAIYDFCNRNRRFGGK